MIIVHDEHLMWCGDLRAIGLISFTPELDKHIIQERIDTGRAKRGEPFKFGKWVCYALTDEEERLIHEEWKAYSDNVLMYAGTVAAELVFEWLMEMHDKR